MDLKDFVFMALGLKDKNQKLNARVKIKMAYNTSKLSKAQKVTWPKMRQHFAIHSLTERSEALPAT